MSARSVFASLVLIAGSTAAILFVWTGSHLVELESQAGGTLAEAYYNEIGYLAYAAAASIVTISLGFAGILIFLLGDDDDAPATSRPEVT